MTISPRVRDSASRMRASSDAFCASVSTAIRLSRSPAARRAAAAEAAAPAAETAAEPAAETSPEAAARGDEPRRDAGCVDRRRRGRPRRRRARTRANAAAATPSPTIRLPDTSVANRPAKPAGNAPLAARRRPSRFSSSGTAIIARNTNGTKRDTASEASGARVPAPASDDATYSPSMLASIAATPRSMPRG